MEAGVERRKTSTLSGEGGERKGGAQSTLEFGAFLQQGGGVKRIVGRCLRQQNIDLTESGSQRASAKPSEPLNHYLSRIINLRPLKEQ